MVLGEATYVDQIMRNLLGNAAKYTPRGSNVVVDVRVEGDDVAVRVTDDGPGIPAASRDRLFELFYRDPDSARTVAGSGIGLFVCASLVDAMGGRIWVARRPAWRCGVRVHAAGRRHGRPRPLDMPAASSRVATAATAVPAPVPAPAVAAPVAEVSPEPAPGG